MEIRCIVIGLGGTVPDDVRMMLADAAKVEPAFGQPSAVVVGRILERDDSERAVARELAAVAVWPEGEAVPLVYVRDGLEDRSHGTLNWVESQLTGYAYSLCGRRAG